jgi:hypothetical protein
MTVGSQMTSEVVDANITTFSVQLRNLMTAINNFSLNINGQANGLAYLESIGYSAADASAALTAIGYLNTPAAVYFGTATQDSDFDFNQELSQYWAGQ